jgi:hypothetical protein
VLTVGLLGVEEPGFGLYRGPRGVEEVLVDVDGLEGLDTEPEFEGRDVLGDVPPARPGL